MEYNTVQKNLRNTKLPRIQTTRRKDISMAENSFQKSSITIEAAERMIKAAETKAQEMGKPMKRFLHLLLSVTVFPLVRIPA